MSDPQPLPLFAAYGIELEYMIVDRDTLEVLPVADRLLESAAGELVTDIEDGPIAWSNELVLHVLELKTNGPAPGLDPLPALFDTEIARVHGLLDAFNGRLMPTAMHPWMNPALNARIWPHGHNEIYASYDRIFDCRGHGWSNLQSMHINLPFAGDAEFHALHTTIRTLLPIMPAIAASSPIMEWELTGIMDTRLETYRHNAKRIPSITGLVIPEAVADRRQYETEILEVMYADIAPHDPDRILRFEWLNSRGAIARFDRDAIEIRVLDTQENPSADLAVAGAVVAALQGLTGAVFADLPAQAAVSTEALAAIFLDAVREAETAVIRDRDYLALFRFPERSASGAELWQHILEIAPAGAGDDWRDVLRFICREGTLARRIARAVGPNCRRSHVRETYRVLCECLAGDQPFEGID